MKTLHCRDAGFDRYGIIRASTEEEVLKQAANMHLKYTMFRDTRARRAIENADQR